MTHIEAAMNKYTESINETDPRDFFVAWQVPAVIIAERLRRTGFPTSAEYINDLLSEGLKDKADHYLLSVAMMEMRNDLTKTLYRK